MIPTSYKELITKYASSAIFKNFFTTLSGTTLAQAIQVLAAPILTYYYSTEIFGVFTLYFSVANSIAVIATLRYELAIMLPEKEDDAKQLVNISLLMTLGLSILTLLVMLVSRSYWATWLDASDLNLFLLLAAFSVLSTGIFQTLIMFATRKEQFKRSSYMRVVQSLTFASFPVVFYYLGFHSSGLVIGYVVSQVVTTFIFSLVSLRVISSAIHIWNWNAMRSQMIRYKGFPGFNSLHAFMDMVQVSVMNFLIAILYGQAALGLYSMAYRVLRAPLGIIGSAISQVLYQKMSDNYNKGISNYTLYRSTVKGIGLFSIPLFSLIALIAPAAFGFFLGAGWVEAGWYAVYMTPLFIFTFISSPLSHLPNINSKQGTFLTMVFSINLFAFSFFYILSIFSGIIYFSLLAYSIIWMLGSLAILYWFKQLSQKSLQFNSETDE